MHNSAGGTGSSPAPVSRYMPSNSSWNLSSNSWCRWSRRNAKSFRVRFSRLMMNCSFLVSSIAGSQRFIDLRLLRCRNGPAGAQMITASACGRSSKPKRSIRLPNQPDRRSSDNPFFDGAGGNADAIFARGLRNPFRMAIQPSTGLVWQLVTGDRWEQVFVLTPGANAGWDAFQNDQDGQTGLLVPVIAYLTNASAANPHQRTMTSASRAGGVATFTTSTPHQFRRGTRLTIAGVSDASFDGTQYVATVVSTTQFTAPSAGPDASATGGTATALVIGGAITDGAFVQGTLLPAEWRGNFVFADLNSGNVGRATLDATNQPTSVDLAANVGSGPVGVASGPDGALYVLTFSGALYRYGPSAGLSPGLIIDRSPLRVEEGGSAALSVRLATVPAGVVTLGASLGGAPETTITSGRDIDLHPDQLAAPPGGHRRRRAGS